MDRQQMRLIDATTQDLRETAVPFRRRQLFSPRRGKRNTRMQRCHFVAGIPAMMMMMMMMMIMMIMMMMRSVFLVFPF